MEDTPEQTWLLEASDSVLFRQALKQIWCEIRGCDRSDNVHSFSKKKLFVKSKCGQHLGGGVGNLTGDCVTKKSAVIFCVPKI